MQASTAGYYRDPTICGDTLVFVSEDDLFAVSAGGGIARRLTASLGACRGPRLSPDGAWIAFTSTDEGGSEVWLMPGGGGEVRRLTYLGDACEVIGWSEAGRVRFVSAAGQPFRHRAWIHEIGIDEVQPQRLDLGPALSLATGGPGGAVVLGRNTKDPARWKRYRGGTVGVLWIDATGEGAFRRMDELEGNLTRPMWVGERLYFISDCEGVGNLYSVAIEAGRAVDLTRHTHHEDFYVRGASTDGKRIVYHAGGDLHLFDPVSGETRKVEVHYHTARPQRARRFVDAARWLQGYDLHPKGHRLATIARGRLFTFANWEGAVLRHGEENGVRYRLARWLHDGMHLVVVSDAPGEEVLELRSADGSTPPRVFSELDLGRIETLETSPVDDQIAVTNHRQQLFLVDLKTGEARCIDHSAHGPMAAARFSPDGRYLAYAIAIARHLSIIRIAEVDSGKTHDVTRPVLWDSAPAWDPKGHYLYFLSTRTLDPVYDAVHFELGFYRADRPYAVALRADEGSPFVPEPKPLKEEKGQAKEDGSAEETPEAPLAGDGGETGEGTPESSAAAPLRIDFQGIADRVVAFPVPPARCVELAAIEGKVLWTTEPVRGALADGGGAGRRTLRGYDFEKQETLRLADGLVSFRVSADGSALAYRDGEQALRVIPAGEKAPEEDGCTRKGGWIDLSRLKISVDPPAEWRQMYREAWRLQRDQFWTEDLSGVDWQAVHDRYLPLLDRVGCRSEFSDLIWEMQGELGTSHAYEYGGDYRPSPAYAQGLLGADLRLEAGQWIIAAIPAGDVWDEAAASPLARPGVDARPGDVILRVAGVPVGADRSPASVLVNLAEEEVELTLKRGDDPPRTVTVRTLGDERPLRYRAWVEANRRLVHARSGGRVGYVHVPDMGPAGYAEFHRYFLVEADRDALVVDVRNNGGGHVSQLLLEKLARRRVGYDQPRWSEPVPYPEDSPAGPLVCVSDELAGSDGDIFTHCFKLLKLGPVVGKRTWGGVIGIAPRHQLVDGGVTTQPEYSFWFEDVGWAVENYGVDPDIEVDIAPQEWREGRDPQLERAVDEALTRLETAPPRRPAFGPRPRLAPPKLPRR